MKNLNTISYSILWLVAMLTVTIHLKATNYYCDPATGSMSNPGTSTSPWSTLEDVFDAGKTFNPGDIIYLRDGYHGGFTITGENSDYVTIQAQDGHSPTLSNLGFYNASYWKISGLTISLEVIGQYPDDYNEKVVYIHTTCSSIIIDNCYVYNTEDITGWDANSILAHFCRGIYCDAPNSQIINNHVKNTRYSIVAFHNATGTVVRNNLIEGISEDGVRCLANYNVIEYNVIRNFYGLNDDHDDGFQAWTGGHDGIPVGAETKYGGIIRGNIVISSLPGNPFPPTYGTQGIGWFDGMFEDYVVENNLICTNMYHGISFYGAKNCKILNNTVVENPYDPKDVVPWIMITKHKTGGPYSDAPSTGNIIRNNIVPRLNNDANIGEVDHNLLTTDYAALFVDYAGLDFRLKATSAAIGAGSSTDAPLTDLEQNARTEPYDVGCYEFTSGSSGDTEAPTVPTGLATTEITEISVNLTWNASTDNTGVTDYRVYINGTDPVTVQGTSATIAPLSPNTSYSFTVSALDAAGNESEQSTAIAITTNELTSITSTASWQTILMSNQTSAFSANFDVVPNDNNMDGVVGILNGNAIGYSSLACIIRFNSSGQIDAIDGANGYSSATTVNYSAGTNYHFRLEIDVPSHTYNVYVTPNGQSEITLGSNFDFRTDQSGVTSLNGLALIAGTGSHTVFNISFVGEGSIPVTGVSVSPSTISIVEGATSVLTETILPSNATDLSVTWSSDNTSIATVDATGLVTAISEGTATITVTTNDGSYTDNCNVIVTTAGGATRTITLNGHADDQSFREDGTLKWIGLPDCRVGGESTLDGNLEYVFELPALNPGESILSGEFRVSLQSISNDPEGNVDLYAVPYRSASAVLASDYFEGSYGSDPNNIPLQDNFATNTSSPGVISSNTTAGSNIAAFINDQYSAGAQAGDYIFLRLNPDIDEPNYHYWIFSMADNSTPANRPVLELEVKTVIPVTGVSLSVSSLDLDEGETTVLSETVLPANATDQSVTWSSSNTSVATVDANGLVTAVTEGDATITITTNDGGFSATCAISVNPVIETRYVTIEGHSDDQRFRSDGSYPWIGHPEARVGGESAVDAVFVIPFELPALAPGEAVLDASFQAYLDRISNSPQGNVDLYAIPYRGTSTVVFADYFQGSYGSDPNNSAIQDNFATISSSPGYIYSDASAGFNLTSFINSQYVAGAQAGDYIFLRLNPDIADVADFNYWAFNTSNSSNKPTLDLEIGASPAKSMPNMKTDVFEYKGNPAVEIFPNPVTENGQLSVNLVNFNAADVILLKITDLTGKTIFIQDNIQVDLDGKKCLRLGVNISKGIYIISANNGKCIKNNKLIVN